MTLLHTLRLALSALLAGLILPSASAADPPGSLVVRGWSDPSLLIPISIEGLSGETLAALRFDLEIAGFAVTNAPQGQFQVHGSHSSSLVGRVTDRLSGSVLLSKEYTGGGARAQVHAFADDIVELFPDRKGVARTKIAFKVTTGKTSEIYIADYDGYNAFAITRDNTISRDPAWMPQQRVLYYTSYKSGNPWIYSHDLQSGVRKIVASFTGLNTGAALSPDGRRVAVILSKSGSPDLYVANADGSNLKQLTQTREDESSPCWSPDGRNLCVVSRVSGRAALYLINPGGGSLRRLTTAGILNATEPSWSPDGKTIAFTANMGGFQICTVPAVGGEAAVLVGGEDPSWAPDSRRLAFTRRVADRRIVSLLDVPTKRVKDIRQISGSYSQPDWAR